MKGKFITFEGGDGSGKTTLIESVYRELSSRRKNVLKTRAPGGTPAGEIIRKLLLNHGEMPLTHRCELFLFLADRAQHSETFIVPALCRGEIVLCDRFHDSTMAYQGAARGFDEEMILSLCLFASDYLQPDLTIYLDLNPAVAMQRLQKASDRKDRIEAEEIGFHEKIRNAFHRIAFLQPDRFYIIDASKSPQEVFQQAMRLIDACGI